MKRPPPKILAVDDDPPIRDLLREVLAREGYVVELAADGEGALTAYYSVQPDLVVLDVMLPKENGYRVCRAIKSSTDLNPGARVPPVLLLTGRRLDHDPEREATLMRFSMADDVLYKPFSNEELVARVASLLERAAEARV